MNTEDQLIARNLQEHRRAGIHDMLSSMRQYNVVVDEIDGRRLRIKDHWVIDFASCNYLGLDLHAGMRQTEDAMKAWGVHPSWCRLVASPKIYDDLEHQLAQLIGTESTLILPTVTLISIGVIPALVGKTGVMILDKSGHETMYEGCKIARDSGATLETYPQGDLTRLESILQKHASNDRKLILVDGVYSMSGDYVRLKEIQQLALRYNALVYIDDAHGFGVVGERPTPERPLGHLGNGIVQHLDLTYENLLYVGGCSKAYSSLAAFIGCSSNMKAFLQGFATPYDLSGPCPTASLATLQAGLQINALEGDLLRDRLWQMTQQVILGLQLQGYHVQNETGFPIVSVRAQSSDDFIEKANALFDLGILVTVCPYPMVKKGEEVFRITLTASNTAQEVAHLLAAMAQLRA